jgi:hypothetical protein
VATLHGFIVTESLLLGEADRAMVQSTSTTPGNVGAASDSGAWLAVHEMCGEVRIGDPPNLRTIFPLPKLLKRIQTVQKSIPF